MIVVEPSATLLGATQFFGSYTNLKTSDAAQLIEAAGRTSWKSEDKIGPESAGPFCDRVLHGRGDWSIAEHASATVRFVTDRIVSHQLVRHRIAAYTQESTHYLNYSKNQFGRQIQVCAPYNLVPGTPAFVLWASACRFAEDMYFDMIENYGVKHYEARYVLPMSLKTELVATYNLHMWKHVIAARTEMNSSGRMLNTPEVHHLMTKAKVLLYKLAPEIFPEYGESQ